MGVSRLSHKILILGLGGVGLYLAKTLSHEGHLVSVIEVDAKRIRKADPHLDARLVRGDATDFACWDRADARGMDMVIAVTDNDAVNILACMIAERCGIRQKIARVRSVRLWDEEALLTTSDLHIDLLIRPGERAAQEIARLLKMRAGEVILDVGAGRMQVVATHVHRHSPLCMMLVRDLVEKYDDVQFQVVAVGRDINTVIPRGDFKLQPDDRVFILARTEDMPAIMELAGVHEDRRHRVLIVGGGLIGSRVAELLQDTLPVRLIEQDEARAEELSQRLRKTECLHGDGSESATLEQAGLLHMDTIVVATGDNETNIMTSLLAKHLIEQRSDDHHAEHGKTIALVKRTDYLALAPAMGADLVVNKKVLAGLDILRYIRRGQLLSVAHLHGCDAEVVELVAETDARITKKPLAKASGLDGILIGAVYRDNTWQIARGHTHVQPGERAVCVCASDHLRELQALFLA